MIAHSATRAGEAVPLVSVILPYYNGARTVLQTLTSLAAQDYPEMEWILVDDASAEPLPSAAQELLRARGDRGKLLRHEVNLGLSRTLNDGIRVALGPLVLIVHQDVELVERDWVTRAVARLMEDDRVAVVTCYYGIPAPEDLTFVMRSFGFLRRQFHRAPTRSRELVPFTEFKCDLVRKSVLDAFGGFETRFRICGEDIMLSYRIRQSGGRILKAYDLRTIQRFTGQAETLAGNLQKEFRFGESLVGALRTFGAYAFHDLGGSAYARSRSLHRASQPMVAIAGLLLLALFLLSGLLWVGVTLILFLVLRYLYYVVRLWPDFRGLLPGRGRAFVETLCAGGLGLLTDIFYPAGMMVGVVRSAIGAPL